MTQLTEMKASTYVSQWSEMHLHGSLVPAGSPPTTSQQGCCKDTGNDHPLLQPVSQGLLTGQAGMLSYGF